MRVEGGGAGACRRVGGGRKGGGSVSGTGGSVGVGGAGGNVCAHFPSLDLSGAEALCLQAQTAKHVRVLLETSLCSLATQLEICIARSR